MDTPEVDSGSQNSPPYTHLSNQDVTKFNQAVLKAVSVQKQSGYRAFQQQKVLTTTDDYSLLLLIILKIIHKEDCRMNQIDCAQYLHKHSSLYGHLARTYLNQEFSCLIGHSEMPSPDEASKCSPADDASASNGSETPRAFEQPYIGGTAQLFIDTLNRYRGAYSDEAKGGTQRPYNSSIPVVQSDGMGKSRMVEEAANSVFTIPINVREEALDDRIGYPPSDDNMREFFTKNKDKPNDGQQAQYAILLHVLFTKATELVRVRFQGVPETQLAREWSDYLRRGQTDNRVGNNRERFFREAIQMASKIFDDKSIGNPDRAMVDSCKAFLELIKSHQSADENTCFIYFDEAHTLSGDVNPAADLNRLSPFHNLGVVLSKLVECSVFFIFLSGNSRIIEFPSPFDTHASAQVTRGLELFAPFTELCFDIHEYKVAETPSTLTLANMCKTGTIVKFGRPLWNAYYESNPEPYCWHVFQFAVAKLGASGLRRDIDNAILAALVLRLGIDFDAELTYSIQSRLVEAHMRVAYAIPKHRRYIHSGASPEPILAEAAGWYLAADGRQGTSIEGPRRISKELECGFLAHGSEKRRDLAGRLLVTSAHDIALEKLHGKIRMDRTQPYYHRPILVLDFLKALFHEGHHQLIYEAKCVTRKAGIQSLGEAFSNSYIFFSHFAHAEDSKMLSAFGMATALVRGAALRVRDGVGPMDVVIPVHMGCPTTPILPKTTSAINLYFKNRSDCLDHDKHGSTAQPDLKMPAISIIFEFGKRTDSVEIHSRCTGALPDTNASHVEDQHYKIIARGCSSALFGAIPRDAELAYQSLLGAEAFLEDFPRYNPRIMWPVCDNLANM